MRPLICAAALVVLALQPCGGARAAEIVAIVEEIGDPAADVAPMDLLEEGRRIDLSEGVVLVIGYLRSCRRETITGGQVTVGAEESTVEGGTREAVEVNCDGGRIVRSSGAASEALGAVFRKGADGRPPLPKPDITLFGVSPLVRLSAPADTIRILRLDAGDAEMVEVPAAGLLVDFAEIGPPLEPGGLYAVSSGSVGHIVKVSPLAEEDAPLLSRLLPL
jgi:hypothetical protein